MARDDERGIADLCRQAEAQLAALGLPDSFDLAQLHASIERRVGRPVRLLARSLPVLAPHGLWVSARNAEYVFYDRSAGPVRQHQIIGHEFGHMLFDVGVSTGNVEPAEPGPDAVARWARRVSYDALPERRAEVFATVAMHRMHLWSPPGAVPPDDPALIARLAATLEGD